MLTARTNPREHDSHAIARVGGPGAGFDGLGTVMSVASIAGGSAAAYHGYKRNGSVGSAIGWGLLGYLFWPITIPVALAQGFGEPAK